MKAVNCYNCGSDKSSFYASENGFALVKCHGCGLLFVNPRPTDEEIEASLKTGLHRGSRTLCSTGTFQPKHYHRYLGILEDVFGDGSTLNNRRWLDIGCGHGEFLLALQEFSKRQLVARGLEPNVNKQRGARGRGLDVSYFDLSEHTDRYDVISSLNVYSHLPDPPSAIATWRHLLKPDGELLLQTGDCADFSSEELIRPFSLPDHLSFASERIVVDILERVGFEVVSINKYPAYRPNVLLFAKEVVKIFWPNKGSSLRYVLKHKKYAGMDMYIRARLKS